MRLRKRLLAIAHVHREAHHAYDRASLRPATAPRGVVALGEEPIW